jgi:hypothetical protein
MSFDYNGEQSFSDITTKDKEWKDEWKGMPEFVQEKQRPYAQIIFRFNSEEDLQDFSKLINQKLTNKTKSAWHPKLERGINSGLRWVDES